MSPCEPDGRRVRGSAHMRLQIVSEEFERWQRYGDASARERIVVEFLPLSRRLASRFLYTGELLDDLNQVASVGLLGAIDRFDRSRGIGFSVFAIPTILGELKRHLRLTSWSAHVPRGAQEMAMRIDRAVGEMAMATGRAPTAAELAKNLGMSVPEVVRGLGASQARQSISLDAQLASDDPSDTISVVDRLGVTDGSFGLIETKLSLAKCFERLPEPERRALMLQTGGDLSQTDVARLMGCSQTQISRLLTSAARHVHQDMEAPTAVAYQRRTGSR